MDTLKAKIDSLVEEVAKVDAEMRSILADLKHTNNESDAMVECKRRWSSLTNRIWKLKQNWED